MDLNPVDLLPSASIPHIPKTDLKEQLKIYGEDDVTVSEESVNVAPVLDGEAEEGESCTIYSTVVLLGLAETTN